MKEEALDLHQVGILAPVVAEKHPEDHLPKQVYIIPRLQGLGIGAGLPKFSDPRSNKTKAPGLRTFSSVAALSDTCIFPYPRSRYTEGLDSRF